MNYNQIYKNNNVWGSKPNELLQKIYEQAEAGSEFLDLGCGQGRDSLFMLQKGFKVTAVDSSQEGIKRIKELVKDNNFSKSNISLFCEDIKTFSIKKNKYSVINAFNSLQFLSKNNALKLIDKIKKAVKIKGYVIISSFISDNSLNKKTMPADRCSFEPRELKKIFLDFDIVFYEEKIIDDKGHPGNPNPHTHNIARIIARKKS